MQEDGAGVGNQEHLPDNRLNPHPTRTDAVHIGRPDENTAPWLIDFLPHG